MPHSVSDATLALFRDLATPTIANALDNVQFPGVLAGLSQVVPGTRAVGRAITVRHVVGNVGDYDSADFKVGHIIDAAGPGDIIVVDMGGHAISTWGGLATLAATVKGIGGLVVDGGVRDQEEMLEHRLPVFARHMTPLTGRTRLKLVSIGEPIQCAGVKIEAGDVIVADGSGVVAIPARHAAKVGELATRYTTDDKSAEQLLRQGLTFREAMAKFTRI
jgi:regulator of RNase E activity RraA